MGVCCGRNVDEPVSKFLEKAAKERIKIGNEEIFKRGIYSIDGSKITGLDLSEIKEIFTSHFVYNDHSDSHYYDFFVKDFKDKMYNVEINILKNSHHQPVYTIRELRDDENTKRTDNNEEVIDYMKYNTNSNLVTNNESKKVKSRNNKVIVLSKKDNNIFTEESKNLMSPVRLTTLSSRSNDNSYVYPTNKFSSPIKTTKTNIESVLASFKENAEKSGISYGNDEYLTRAIGLIETKNKVITHIETDIFEFNETDRGIEYKFSFIESMKRRYICDIIMDNECDTIFLHKPNQKSSIDRTAI
jgi:hypothetical protein